MNTKAPVALIPARGGSKGIPRKNLVPFDGRPLLEWTIEDALESKRLGGAFVSTEDPEIASAARRAGAEVLQRPAALAADDTSTEAVLLHALDALRALGRDPSIVCLLQATSPLRPPGLVDRALERLEEAGADSLLTVAAERAFGWRPRGLLVEPLYDPRKRPRRQVQDDPAWVLREVGSLYLTRQEILRRDGCRLGGRVAHLELDPPYAFEIDSPFDLWLGERLLDAPGVQR